MVKKPGVVWNYYIKKVDGSAVIAFCKFCERSYMQNATRMEKHLARCEKATPEVKHLFLRVSTSKRVNRARLMGAKMPIDWLKQHRELGLDVSTLTEADLDDINEWNRHKDMANEETAVQSISLTEDVSQEDINWDGNEEEIDESPTKKVNDAAKSAKVWVKQLPENYVINQNDYSSESNKNCNGSTDDHDVNHIHIQSVTSLSPGNQHQPTTSSSSITTAPTASSTLGHSPLESRILQEKLLEKRAQRKIAELELRRKTFELERYQWEYERDKAQSDIRWEHETRMMEIKEEHEKKLIQVHVQEG